MKSFIKWLLNHLPRPLMQRLAGFGVPLIGLLYLGRGKECPICGAKRRKFLPYGYNVSRDNALCPSCLSLERHRLLWLYLQRETTIMQDSLKILHIAPEVAYIKRLRKVLRDRYITADLESPLADIHFDIQYIPLEDDYADVILCNHILEHIPDEGRAIDEIYRILRPGGWAVLLVPVDNTRETTLEGNTITDPGERNRLFGQYDHYRAYGRDYADRLRSHGFIVDEINYFDTISTDEQSLYALSPETLFIVRK